MSTVLTWAARLPAPVRRYLLRSPVAHRLRWRLAGHPSAPGPRRGELRAVVYAPTWVAWDTMRQRPQYLVETLAAAGHPAYFVDPRRSHASVDRGVHVVPDLAGTPQRGALLYTHFAPVREVFERFDDPVIVYDVLDDLSIYEAGETHVPPERRVATHHPELMLTADVVIVSSPALAERHRRERPDLVLVPNGVDAARFAQPAARPADLPNGRPVVGYHGAVAPWFDFELLEAVATARPEYDFVVVGPVDPAVVAIAADVSRLANIVMLGERPSDTMPGYAQAFDVGAIWFRIDHLTEAVTPLKLYEYLSAGTPVVATPLPAARTEAEVRTAASAPAFAAALDAAMADAASPAFAARARRAGAAASWTARIAPQLAALEGRGVRRVGTAR